MQKLTLSVDEGVIERAKQYADARDTSVSRLVETFLDLVARDQAPQLVRDAPARRMPPVLARLRGSLRRANVADYRRHLEKKYR